ncbi:hypothetical protein CROQUDRAFT_88154 [Cronartium quercuum f. sp. fusiforme G11]|uniref:Uncharacterized protein n=1 Tax=Cronartium quercuum f. sp. fusiforme G11 TaxID=708437 RepID=A0A9P6TG35_9BASI|nr:hypothetical protein CROQUDRAFT_88154 [Cronartium quercuum f. sp. fusiforme G11]
MSETSIEAQAQQAGLDWSIGLLRNCRPEGEKLAKQLLLLLLCTSTPRPFIDSKQSITLREYLSLYISKHRPGFDDNQPQPVVFGDPHRAKLANLELWLGVFHTQMNSAPSELEESYKEVDFISWSTFLALQLLIEPRDQSFRITGFINILDAGPLKSLETCLKFSLASCHLCLDQVDIATHYIDQLETELCFTDHMNLNLALELLCARRDFHRREFEQAATGLYRLLAITTDEHDISTYLALFAMSLVLSPPTQKRYQRVYRLTQMAGIRNQMPFFDILVLMAEDRPVPVPPICPDGLPRRFFMDGTLTNSIHQHNNWLQDRELKPTEVALKGLPAESGIDTRENLVANEGLIARSSPADEAHFTIIPPAHQPRSRSLSQHDVMHHFVKPEPEAEPIPSSSSRSFSKSVIIDLCSDSEEDESHLSLSNNHQVSTSCQSASFTSNEPSTSLVRFSQVSRSLTHHRPLIDEPSTSSSRRSLSPSAVPRLGPLSKRPRLLLPAPASDSKNASINCNSLMSVLAHKEELLEEWRAELSAQNHGAAAVTASMRNTFHQQQLFTNASEPSSELAKRMETIDAYSNWYTQQSVCAFPITGPKAVIWVSASDDPLAEIDLEQVGSDLEWAQLSTDKFGADLLTQHTLWRQILLESVSKTTSGSGLRPSYLDVPESSPRLKVPKVILDLSQIKTLKFIEDNYKEVMCCLRYSSQGRTIDPVLFLETFFNRIEIGTLTPYNVELAKTLFKRYLEYWASKHILALPFTPLLITIYLADSKDLARKTATNYMRMFSKIQIIVENILELDGLHKPKESQSINNHELFNEWLKVCCRPSNMKSWTIEVEHDDVEGFIGSSPQKKINE